MPENSGFFGGRGSVSKTVGRGFETFFPCQEALKQKCFRAFWRFSLFIVVCGLLKASETLLSEAIFVPQKGAVSLKVSLTRFEKRILGATRPNLIIIPGARNMAAAM